VHTASLAYVMVCGSIRPSGVLMMQVLYQVGLLFLVHLQHRVYQYRTAVRAFTSLTGLKRHFAFRTDRISIVLFP
jgi:hypothetical protein